MCPEDELKTLAQWTQLNVTIIRVECSAPKPSDCVLLAYRAKIEEYIACANDCPKDELGLFNDPIWQQKFEVGPSTGVKSNSTHGKEWLSDVNHVHSQECMILGKHQIPHRFCCGARKFRAQGEIAIALPANPHGNLVIPTVARVVSQHSSRGGDRHNKQCPDPKAVWHVVRAKA